MNQRIHKVGFALKFSLSFVNVSIGSLPSFNFRLPISKIVNEWIREREREPVHNLHTWFHHLCLPCMSMPRLQSPMYLNQNNWGPFSRWLQLHNFESLSNITFWLKLWIFLVAHDHELTKMVELVLCIISKCFSSKCLWDSWGRSLWCWNVRRSEDQTRD